MLHPGSDTGMMDDTLGPKHHINPAAQRDHPKVAAAVSPSPQVQARRQAACEEEDTLVTRREEPSRLVWLQEMEWREQKRERRSLAREERGRHSRERAEWAAVPLENE